MTVLGCDSQAGRSLRQTNLSARQNNSRLFKSEKFAAYETTT